LQSGAVIAANHIGVCERDRVTAFDSGRHVPEVSMLKSEIKTAIDHHSHCVRGVRHQFKLQWAALEPRWSSRSARYLLAIEVLSDAGTGSSTMHVVTQAGTNRTDLLRLVDDALEDYLEREHPATVRAYPSERTAS
jgi:hypothetical protein